MYTCIIWGTGLDYENYINLIHYQELQNTVKVLGVTSDSTIYRTIDGYPFIPKKMINNYDFDILIVMSMRYFKEIRQEALAMGIDEHKILRGNIFSLPDFNLEQYMDIKLNNLTIFSNLCWGGITYNRLGLKFNSPFINMFLKDWDYIKLLNNPKKYMSQALTLLNFGYDPRSDKNYPICLCGDIQLHFNHNESFEEATELWNKRKTRINWNNLFIMSYTEDKKVADAFDKLPYEKKICFVPFETGKKSLFYIDYRNKNEISNMFFWELVNTLATGQLKYYNLLDLLNGYKTKKVESV